MGTVTLADVKLCIIIRGESAQTLNPEFLNENSEKVIHFKNE